MHFLKTIGSLLLVAATALAANGPNAFNVPAGGYNVQAGSSLTLSWNPTTSGTVTLQLRFGNPGALDPGSLIAGTYFLSPHFLNTLFYHRA